VYFVLLPWLNIGRCRGCFLRAKPEAVFYPACDWELFAASCYHA